MRIAFDLDDTLIPGMISFPVEPLPRGCLRRQAENNSCTLAGTTKDSHNTIRLEIDSRAGFHLPAIR